MHFTLSPFWPYYSLFLALAPGCVSQSRYDQCQAELRSVAVQRDEYKTELEKKSEDVSKCLTQMGVLNNEKEFCAVSLSKTADSYDNCRNGCMIDEFEGFKQRTREEYQTQLDGYKQTSSEECKTQMERVTQEALTQQNQLQARITKSEEQETKCKSSWDFCDDRWMGCRKERRGLERNLEECQNNLRRQTECTSVRYIREFVPVPPPMSPPTPMYRVMWQR